MAHDHTVPVSEPEPESDIVVALFIPLDTSYTQLVLGALSVLVDENYYERDADGGNEGAKAAAEIFMRRMFAPLVESLSLSEE